MGHPLRTWNSMHVLITPHEGADLEQLRADVKALLSRVQDAHVAVNVESTESAEDKIVRYLEKAAGTPKRGVEIAREALGYRHGGEYVYKKLRALAAAGKIYTADGKTYESRIPDDD